MRLRVLGQDLRLDELEAVEQARDLLRVRGGSGSVARDEVQIARRNTATGRPKSRCPRITGSASSAAGSRRSPRTVTLRSGSASRAFACEMTTGS
jgi:hypothetical protein